MPPSAEPRIILLPNEILRLILGFLDGASLARCTQISRRFNVFARSDNLWARFVSSLRLNSPAPYESFKELYAALHRHLWLHGQVWYGDRRFTGYLLIARYSPISGAIEIYNLLANQNDLEATSRPWSRDSTVVVVDFNPHVRLWEEPILVLTKDTPYNESHEMQPPSRRGRGLIYCSLSRASVVPLEQQDRTMSLWPPTLIPSRERTRSTSVQGSQGDGHQPRTDGEAAKSLFRLRTWMTFGVNSNTLETKRRPPVGNNVETFSALDKSLYTPDREYPLRGLWVGDYSVNGCEIILFHQPTPDRLEGIKITGDLNVPRGEYTFTFNNLKDLIRIAGEVEWPGATVVGGRGQLADSQFVDAEFVDLEMIIISLDEVAFYWCSPELGDDIRRFKRLDIDKFVYDSDAIIFPASH